MPDTPRDEAPELDQPRDKASAPSTPQDQVSRPPTSQRPSRQRSRGSRRLPGSPVALKTRIGFVALFHVIVLAGAWHSATPLYENPLAAPSDLTMWFIVPAVFMYFVLLVHTNKTLAKWLGLAGFFTVMAGLGLLGPTIDRVQRNWVLERVEGAVVVETHTLNNGMPRVIYELPGGDRVKGYFMKDSAEPRSRSSSESRDSPPFQVARWPYAKTAVGQQHTVMADRDGWTWSRNAVGNDGTPQGRSDTIPWIIWTILLLAPAEIIAVSSLTRTESLWSAPSAT